MTTQAILCPICHAPPSDRWGEDVFYCHHCREAFYPQDPAPVIVIEVTDEPQSRALTVGAWLCLALLFVVGLVFLLNLCWPKK